MTTNATKKAQEANAPIKAEVKPKTIPNYYEKSDAYFSEDKKANRFLAIVENVEKSQKGYKFKPLTLSIFDKDEKNGYVDAVDNYHKIMYLTKSTKAKDTALIKVLQFLSVDNKTIHEIRLANLHDLIVQNVARFVQRMKDDAREVKKAKEEVIDGLKSVIAVYNNTGEMPSGWTKSLDATRQDLEKAEKDLKAFLETDIYEPAKISQVTAITFRKYMEFTLGGFCNRIDIVDNYITTEEKRLNNRWNNEIKKAVKAGISSEVINGYIKNNDFDGLSKLRKETNKAKKESK